MDIGSSLADCLFQHVINELYDWGIVDILIDHTIHFIFLEQIGSFLLIIIGSLDCFGISVILIDRQHNLTRRCDSRLGLEAEIVSLNFARSLGRAVGRGAHLQAADGLVEELRVIKDADEIKALERSFALNHAMLRWLEESQLQPGRSEAELAWAIEKYFRDNGASELAFPSIVAVDQNAALPHAIPGEKKLPDNGLVLVDVGCRVDGYCSDQTRTFWVGDAPHKEFRETMKLVRDAQQAALDKMRPGLPLHEAYTLARGVFEKAGVEAWFTHGLGHGVGLETHEAPSLGRRGDKVLQEGMVVTVEPGLYYPQWGGIRWEYTVLITADGNRIL